MLKARQARGIKALPPASRCGRPGILPRLRNRVGVKAEKERALLEAKLTLEEKEMASKSKFVFCQANH